MILSIDLITYTHKSLQKNPRDANNFDAEFTKEDPVLTPIGNDVIRCINQDEFAGFSFVNPKYVPERKVF